jgi:hypothetical protein
MMICQILRALDTRRLLVIILFVAIFTVLQIGALRWEVYKVQRENRLLSRRVRRTRAEKDLVDGG